MTKQELLSSARINGDFAGIGKTDFLQYNPIGDYREDAKKYAYDCKFFSSGILSYWKKTGRVTFKKMNKNK